MRKESFLVTKHRAGVGMVRGGSCLLGSEDGYGIVFRTLQDILGPSSMVYGFDPIYASLTPIAICFVIGSVMFLYESWQTFGTWLFIVGSILFATKPTLRLARELKLAAMGDADDLAKRLNG